MSAAATTSLDDLGALAAQLLADPRLAADVVTRPHPLLVLVSRGELSVVITVAAVWDRGRDLLVPFAERVAAGTSLIVVLGRPAEHDFAVAIDKGLVSVLGPRPTRARSTSRSNARSSSSTRRAARSAAESGCAATATSSASS